MKITLGVEAGSYVFNAAAKTVTFNGIPVPVLESIVLITNVNQGDNVVIYQFNKLGKGGVLVGNVLTLEYDTTTMSNSDPIRVDMDILFDYARESKQQTDGLTDSELRAAPIPVTGTLISTPSGTQDVNIISSIVLDVSGSSVNVANFPAIVAVSQSGTWSVGRTWNLSSGLDSVTVVQGTSPWIVSGTVTSVPSGTQDVNITGSIPLTLVEPVSVDDGGGSLTVDATNLDIRDLVFAQDKVDVTGSAVGAAQVGAWTTARSWTLNSGTDSVTVDGAVAVTQSTTPWVTNDPGIPDTLGQKARANSLGATLSTEDIATLTPPAAITGFATSAIQTDRTQKTQITDGTTDASVKAASTLPLATDKALVVTQRDSVPAGTNKIGGVTEADGDNVVLGATTDAIVAAGATGSVSAKLRRLTSDLDAIKTSVQLIDDALFAEDSAHTSTDKGNFSLAVRNDSAAASVTSTNNDYSQFSVNDRGEMLSKNIPYASSINTPLPFSNRGANATLNVKATSAQVFSATCHNKNALLVRYLQLHNTATVPAAAAVPVLSFIVNPGVQIGVGTDIFTENGLNFSNGVAFAFSTTEDTYTAGAAADQTTQILYV